MTHGTKLSVEALEELFKTGKKPTQDDFYNLFASFYHKDEDLAFLISISKATVTDVQAAEDHTRFMTALRTFQAIEYWGRLGRLSQLYTDVNNLIMQRINEMWSQLLATDDPDTQIDTLGEVFQALQNFTEWTGGIKNEFDYMHSVLKDITGERYVKNTLENHTARHENTEMRLRDVPNTERQVQNNFDSLFSRLTDITGHREVKNTFETLQSLLRDMTGDRTVRNNFDALNFILKDITGERYVKNTLENHDGRINTAQGRADDAYASAAAAHSIINRPGGTTETVWSRITGVYSYAESVAGALNQVQNSLSGFTLGDLGNVKGYIDYVNGRADDLYVKHFAQQAQLDSIASDLSSANSTINAIITKLTSLGYWP